MDPEHDMPVGTRFLSRSGRIWTVRGLTAERFVMTSAAPSGDRGIVVDLAALLRMVRAESAEPSVTVEQIADRAPARRADPVPTSTAAATDD